MKFKVGDKVVITRKVYEDFNSLQCIYHSEPGINDSMFEYIGNVVTIYKTIEKFVEDETIEVYKVEENNYWWVVDWLKRFYSLPENLFEL